MLKSTFGKIDEYDAEKEESTNNVERLMECQFGINWWAKTGSLFLSYRCKVLQANTESGGARKAWQSFVQWPHENTYRSLQSSAIRDHQALSLIGNTGRLNNPSQLTWQSYTHWRSTADTEAHWSMFREQLVWGITNDAIQKCLTAAQNVQTLKKLLNERSRVRVRSQLNKVIMKPQISILSCATVVKKGHITLQVSP